MPLFLGWRFSRALLKLNTTTTAATATATSLLNLIWHNSHEPAMSLMRFRSSCRSLHLRELCTSTSTSTSDHTHLLISAFNTETSNQHFFSIPIFHPPKLCLGSLTPLFTLPSHPFGLTSSQYLNPFFLLHHADYPHYDHTPILAYNPTTQQTLTLPLDPPLPAATTTTWNVRTHFGFDPSTKHYKVLRVKWTEPIPRSIPKVINMVFTVLTLDSNGSGSGSWRRINPVLPFDPKKYVNGGESVCVNGAIHWLTSYGDSIVAFDLKDEKFRLIPLPHDYKDLNFDSFRFQFERLFELGGCLALISDNATQHHFTLELWILKDYNNHVWVKESICFPFRWRKQGQPIPIGTIPTGEILLKPLSLDESATAWVLFYDMEGQSFKKIDITGLPEWVYSSGTRIIRTISVYGG
ncbi:putative F-box protein At1g53360 [Quercus suber]